MCNMHYGQRIQQQNSEHMHIGSLAWYCIETGAATKNSAIMIG